MCPAVYEQSSLLSLLQSDTGLKIQAVPSSRSMQGDEWLITVTTPLRPLSSRRLIFTVRLCRENCHSVPHFSFVLFWWEPRHPVENDGNSVKSQIKCESKRQWMKKIEIPAAKRNKGTGKITTAISCTIPAACGIIRLMQHFSVL